MHGRTGCEVRPACPPQGQAHGCFYLSFTSPAISSSPQPFPPSPLQDIYELKDQIQDVEGRYMQGLKELKVEGLELKACLLLSFGNSLASLTPTHPPSTAVSLDDSCFFLLHGFITSWFALNGDSPSFLLSNKLHLQTR